MVPGKKTSQEHACSKRASDLGYEISRYRAPRESSRYRERYRGGWVQMRATDVPESVNHYQHNQPESQGDAGVVIAP